MTITLFWIAVTAGSILIILLSLSLISGLDLDFDLDFGGSEVDANGGGLGFIKGFLTFISVCTWVAKIFLDFSFGLYVAFIFGGVAGILAVFLLAWIFSAFIGADENVNWHISEALNKTGKVYLKVNPDNSNGIIQVEINGVLREIKAQSIDGIIPTGSNVKIVEINDQIAMVDLL